MTLKKKDSVDDTLKVIRNIDKFKDRVRILTQIRGQVYAALGSLEAKKKEHEAEREALLEGEAALAEAKKKFAERLSAFEAATVSERGKAVG